MVLSLWLVPPLQAQDGIHLSGMMIPAWTRLDPAPGGGSRDEFKLVEPMVMLHASALQHHLQFQATVDFEGWTMDQGQLTLGAWGEGFYDRRHPHTYFHELLVSGTDLLGRLDGKGDLSLTVGKGFAPFGSDDPMSRPAFAYPINHHLSQILERAVAIVGYHLGPFNLEGGIFNGDEPTHPGAWPLVERDGDWRFGDSWSVRLTLRPVSWLEFSGSRASVHSPEQRLGAGPDDQKWHLNARMDRMAGTSRLYAMVEWARTTEAHDFFEFHSVLAEAQWQRGPHRVWYRLDHSDRPEDQRTLDPFRSVRPHLENSTLGTTRWTLHSFGYGLGLHPVSPDLLIEPFAEFTVGGTRALGAGAFNPDVFYGGTSFTSISIGTRISWRFAGHRMGRYGSLADWDEQGGGMMMMDHGM